MTEREWKRECKRSFFAFVDWTNRWETDGAYLLDHDDATMKLVEAIHRYQEWESLDCLMPRGTGKTTIIQKGDVWLTWRLPWMQTLFLTATPSVADDCFEYTLRMCREHPFLEAIRPTVVKGNKKEFDVSGRRGKGRSFRFRTADSKQTGTRCFNLSVDDLEVPETVANVAQRRKMRLRLAETGNLFYKGVSFRRKKKVGTPWDFLTIMRDGTADVHIEIPSVVVNAETGVREYPFKVLQESDLAKIRKELFQQMGSDWLFRSQYLLDTSRDEETVPIKTADIQFKTFEHTELFNTIMVVDPAGGQHSPDELRDMRMGTKRGDGMTVMVGGTIKDTLYILDIFSESVRPEQFLDAVEAMTRLYRPYECWVESNFNSWEALIRMRIEQKNLSLAIEPFWAHGKKLDRILSTLVPLMGTGRVVFHERLRHYTKLVDPSESQYLNLRFHSLPAYDDVIDANHMLIDKLDEYLYPERDEIPKGKSPLTEARMESLGIPKAVQRRISSSAGTLNDLIGV